MEHKSGSRKFRDLYGKLLRLYPDDYREKFGESMMQTFDDLCHEREQLNRGMFVFILRVFVDTLKHGVKEYLAKFTLHLKNAPFAIIGFILVSPFAVMFAFGLAWQILYNLGTASSPNVGSFMPSRTVGISIALILPALALLLNLGTLIFGKVKAGPSAVLSMQFVKSNFATLAIVILSGGAIVFMVGHDAIPCFVHGILRDGFRNIWSLISVCGNA